MSENSYQMNVSRDDFSKLLMLLGVFENACTDCDIKGGKFRCRSNDRQAVISMDLNGILENNDFVFSLIKNKVALMRSFELDENIQVEDKTIRIESNESNYEIRDPFSRIVFRKPAQRYIDNQFITDDDFAGMTQISEDNLLFTCNINNYIKRRISNIALGFETDHIDCTISEGKAAISVRRDNKEDTSNVINDITLNRDVGTKYFRMIALPFVIDIAADLQINCYTTSTNDVYFCKFSQTFFGIPIIIYTRVKVTNSNS